jgi:hypothetical protein
MQLIETIKNTASQASSPDSLLGWGIPNYQKAYTSLSVHNQAAVKALRSYPNPVVDKLTIGFPASLHGKYTLDIIDIQGKVVYSLQGNESPMLSLQINNMGAFPSGIYLVKVSNNSSVYSGRIVKM